MVVFNWMKNILEWGPNIHESMNHWEAGSLPVVVSLKDTAYSRINGIPKVWIQMRRKDFHSQMGFCSLPVVPGPVSWFSVSISGCTLSAYAEVGQISDFLNLIQLCWIKLLVPRGRIELPTRGFSGLCSTDWATSARAVTIKRNGLRVKVRFFLWLLFEEDLEDLMDFSWNMQCMEDPWSFSPRVCWEPGTFML